MQNGRKKGKFFVRCMFSIYYEKSQITERLEIIGTLFC